MEADTATGAEDAAQAHQDAWALRILTCPRRACRRRQRCTRYPDCPGLETVPFTPAAEAAQMQLLERYLEQIVPLTDAAEKARIMQAEREAGERRRRLAFQRARETLGLRPKRRGGTAKG